MLDFIYTLFIAPLEYWMHAALAWGHARTGNWGEAILVMSLVVNLAILPIYMKAERWQEDERALRKGFEEKERMIRRVFKGQERFAMITTMHRQAGYSPFLTLRSSIGFFLQIPFFFAAYHFLSHFGPLAGVSFLGLPDLSRPDGLIRIAGLSVNVMPFVMTAVNLASALVYTKNLTAKDRIQLYAMAALFLVLLYDAASGLVLYWTCNNVFSFAKNVCYDIAARIDLPGRLAAAAARVRERTRPQAVPSGGAGLALAAVGLWAAGLVLALLASNQATALPEALKATLGLASDGAFLGAAILSMIELFRVKAWRNHRLLLAFALPLLLVLLRVWARWAFLGANRRAFSLSAGIVLLVVTLALLNIRRPFAPHLLPSGNRASPARLFAPASVWLVVLLAGYLPVEAYTTAPEIFSPPETVLARSLLWGAALGILLWALGRLAFLWNAERLAGCATALAALILTAYAFLLPLDVGTIDAFQIADPAPLYRTGNLLLDLAVVGGITLLLFAALRRGLAGQLSRVIAFACVAAVGAGIAGLWQCRGTWQTADDAASGTDAAEALPAWNERLLGLSREGTNTVIVMLDAFTGPHMREIQAEMPDIARRYAGFTWYRNTTATGNSTKSSIASILIGSTGTPEALSEGEGVPLEERINARYAETIRALPAGTDVALYERNWLEPVRLARALEAQGAAAHPAPLAIRQTGDAYLDLWINRTGAVIGRGSSDEFLLAVSLFKSVPWSARNLVYRNGAWIEGLLGNRDETLVLRAQRDWAFLSLLPEVSNAAARGSTLRFIDLEITHWPWFMDPGACEITRTPKRIRRPDGVEESHLACEACALERLADWFDWMRREGVWENTNIVVVSDHSAGDAARAPGGTLPAVGRPDALLLFRPAGAGPAPLRTDDAPVTIANVGDWLRGAPFDAPHAERRYWQAKPSGTQFIIGKRFTCTGDVIDPKAWRED